MQVVNNGEIVRMLRDMDRASSSNSYDIDSLSLTTKLSTIIAINQDIQSISFISKDHYIKGIYRWKNRTPKDVSGFLTTLEDGSNFRWFPTRFNTYVDSLNTQSVDVFSLSKQIYKTSDDSPVGIIAVLDIRGEVLRELGSSSTNNDRDIQSFVIDGQGQIVSYGDNSMIGRNVRDVLGEHGYSQIVDSGQEEFRFPLDEHGKKLIVNFKRRIPMIGSL